MSSNNTIDFVKGLYYYTESENSAFFKEIKKMLRRLRIPYVDECCDDEFLPEDAAGGGGVSCVDCSYVHEQLVASSTWTVAHNLGYFPNVVVVDSGGNKVIGSVKYLDENTVELKFTPGNFSGKAYFS